MKHFVFTLSLFLTAFVLSGQTLVYTYELDTVHSGGSMRIDSFYLVENVTGQLVGTGAVADVGDREQTLSSPIFMTDTAQLTTLVEQYLQDSTTLAAKIVALRDQSIILGAKARAIQALRDSVIYGAFLFDLEEFLQPQPGHVDERTGQVDDGDRTRCALAGWIRRKNR